MSFELSQGADVYRFLLALVIGLVIGIERERSHPPGHQALGVRSFTVLSLLGWISAWLDDAAYTAIVSAFVAGLILLSYWRSTRNAKSDDLGITTELSAGLVYGLGHLAFFDPFLGALVGVILLITLLIRKKLHFFSRHWIRGEEIEACAIILVFAVGILPFIPNHGIDPWHLFNPRNFAFLVMLVALIQFGGYMAIRLFGARAGLSLTGFFGGLVSSTAVFLNFHKVVHKNSKVRPSHLSMALFAIVGKLVELAVIVGAASPELLSLLSPVLVAMIGTALACIAFLSKRKDSAKPDHHHRHPLDIRSVLKLSLMIGGMIFVVGLARVFLGSSAAHILTFMGGLFELHSVSLATASLYLQQQMGAAEAISNLALALVASFISKLVILIVFVGGRFGVVLSALILLIMTSGLVTYLTFGP